MKHAGYFNIIWAVVVVFINVSCQPDTTCREKMTTGMVCTYSEAYIDATQQVRYITAWDSLTVIGNGKAEALYARSINVQKISLPLRLDQDSTIYMLTYHQQTDTLTVYHTNTQEFVSVECGCTCLHDILSIRHTKHWIDTITISETSITRARATNVQIIRYAH